MSKDLIDGLKNRGHRNPVKGARHVEQTVLEKTSDPSDLYLKTLEMGRELADLIESYSVDLRNARVKSMTEVGQLERKETDIIIKTQLAMNDAVRTLRALTK